MKINKNHFAQLSAFLLLTGCFSGGSGGGSKGTLNGGGASSNTPPLAPENQIPSGIQGFALPEQVEVVPTETNSNAFKLKEPIKVSKKSPTNSGTVSGILGGLVISAEAITAATDQTVDMIETNNALTDYQRESFQLKVSANELEHFEVINSILKALKQARYDDPKVLGKGPYAALIRWEEGQSSKIEKWILDSRLVNVGGNVHHIIDLYINEDEKDHVHAIMDISSPATLENPYGQWEVNARMVDVASSKEGQFHASVGINAEGKAEISIRTTDIDADNRYEGLGKLILTDSRGKGVFRFPNYYRDSEGNQIADMKTTHYAYDETQLATKVQSDDVGEEQQTICRSRNNYYDVIVDYSVYNSAGDNLKNINRYGLNLEHEKNGKKQYVWYGAYQGRHGIYGPNSTFKLADGENLVATETNGKITRGDSFTFAGCRDGYLSERHSVTTNLEELIGSVLQSWEYRSYQLKYVANENAFFECLDYPQGNCNILSDVPFNLDEHVNDDEQKISVGMYLNSNFSFQKVTRFAGEPTFYNEQSMEEVVLQDGDRLSLYDSRVLFLEYANGQWLKHDYFYDPERNEDWKVEIGNDVTPFAFFKRNNEYRLSTNRFEYILSLNHLPNGEAQVIKVERVMDLALNPQSDQILNGSELFRVKYRSNELEGGLFYDSDIGYLLNAQGQPIQDWIGDLYSPNTETKYRWNYDRNGNDWAKVCYLKNSQNEFEILDPAIFFNSIQAGDKNTGIFGYDGHIFGLPNYWEILRDNDGELPAEEIAKIISVPEGNYQALDSTELYHIRPRYGVRVLNRVEPQDCHIDLDNSITLDEIGPFVDPGVGVLPNVGNPKVIEGVFVD